MDILVSKLMEFSFGLCESIIFFNFFSNIFNKKIANKCIYTGIIILYSMVIYYSTNMTYFSISKLILSISVLILLVVILYEGTLKNKIIFTIIAVIVMILSDIVVANILMIVMKIDLQKMLFEENWSRVFLVCLCKMLVFIILKMICYFVDKANLDIPLEYWYMVLTIFSILFIILTLIGKIGAMSQYYFDKSIYFIVCSVGILIITIFINYIFLKLGKYYEKEQEYKIIELKSEIMEKHYLEKEELYNETRKLRHDFKNHIICTLSLIKNNKIQEGIEYIESINNVVVLDSILIRSGNDIVDAILNQKSILAEEYNINIDVKANIPKEIKIKSIDLLSVLSNIIDNAIEASREINNEDKKRIDVRINPYKDYLLISISNSAKTNPISTMKKFQSTKKDKKNHGLGVKIINNIAEKYDGFVEYFYKDNIFTIKILMKLI
ncbi:GHKL domain-containing protein [Clostridium sp. OS1-26]|uniref:sensor histidine kinase n=1 Tax=Clostridium sp. OS1-26 TaxID=3070681 RepID=UPI0027E1515D|nr:GHKL domain-containing protein [Clostridium sp. OS1-26]WML33882.1 GHKL domain-containing protein [Clostridium sp. OS1-26]